MRLDDVSAEALKEQQIAFREKFGRDPGPNDPIFFDPESDEPRPIREEDFTQASVEAMRQAGIDPALIYAFEKTGMLSVGEVSDHKFRHCGATQGFSSSGREQKGVFSPTP